MVEPTPKIVRVVLAAAGAAVFLGIAWIVTTAMKTPRPPARMPPVHPSAAPSVPRTERPKGAARFVAWVGAHRASPNAIPGAEPECKTDGPEAGQCSVQVRDEVGGLFTARYFEKAPTAVRFTDYEEVDVTCADLGGVSTISWPERTGPFAPGGERCALRTRELDGLDCIIERNRDQAGRSTAVHIYSKAYTARDLDFASAVRQNEARSR
jgi:hypothetical protein